MSKPLAVSTSRDSSRPSPSSSLHGRSRGRPLKRVAELKPPRKVRAQQAALIHKQLSAETQDMRVKQLSKLERLPVEIIEQIFFHCLELNLPRASLDLARALSRPAIYSSLVLFAYHEPHSVDSHVETHHFLPATYRPIPEDERLRLQTDIPRCGWFTLALFKSCLLALSRLQMVDCWHREQTMPQELTYWASRPQSMQMLSERVLPALDDKFAMERYFRARMEHHLPDAGEALLGPTNQDGYLPFIFTPLPWLDDSCGPRPGGPYVRRGHSVIAVLVLPDIVLRGAPWTDDKIKLLQFLRQAMRYEVHARKLVMSLDALYDGMANAIVEGHEKALLVLLELHSKVIKYETTRVHGCRVSSGETHILPLRLFHLACSTNLSVSKEVRTRMLDLLMQGGFESISSEDEIMTRWATHVVEEKSESSLTEEADMARLVLSYMQEQAQVHVRRRQQGPVRSGPSFTETINYCRSEASTRSQWTLEITDDTTDK